MADQQPVRVLTVGTGAVGAIYSWRLAQTCHVTTVCRSNYDAVSQNGFEIESPKFGNGVFRPHHVVRTVSDAKEFGPFDFIVVTLKALDVYKTADIISPAVVEGKTTIVLIQNGYDIEPPIVERFPKNPLISIVAYIGTSQVAAGKIKMKAIERLQVGTHPASVDSTVSCEKFKELLTKGGVLVEPVDNIVQVRFEKLFWNGSFSPVCAVLGLNTTEVIENEMAVNLVKRLMREIMAAAEKELGISYVAEANDRIDGLIEGTAQGAAHYKPSMQLDLERKQPMEVEVILGTALKSAKKNGLDVPTLQAMHDLCKSFNIHHTKKAQL
ncbi:ketopantoate reductase PanE/ApbA-domain-containing protein [Phascolomyces articulosus]|uniref:2-dehydropantoate 2-reductase n=1 Tax=Phascolomyces articulosus TaxID=60185 RepID=A0AAD5KAV8_9FUNG|nr:ketopantoate reductase PanE/ApbA-domain-containing protein [Phascolomyces articulosus]